MHNFVQEIQSLIETKSNLLPFNILYPINVFLKEKHSFMNNLSVNCSEIGNEIILIHKWLGKSLQEIIK